MLASLNRKCFLPIQRSLLSSTCLSTGTRFYGNNSAPRGNRYLDGNKGDFSSRTDDSFYSSSNAPTRSFENLPPVIKEFYSEHPEVTAMSDEEIQQVYVENGMRIAGAQPLPRPITKFEHAGLPESLMRTLNSNGFEAPSAIQKIGWPVALSGRDMVAVAETGSGKTLGFLLPGLVHIQAQTQCNDPLMLVVAPTRELVNQISQEAERFLTGSGIRVACLYGGTPPNRQLDQLKKRPQLIVATPGRLMDFVTRGQVDISRVSYLALDEADRMLDMGFEPQVRSILKSVRPDKQILLWSATWPKEIRNIAAEFCKERPVKVNIGAEDLTANPRIKHEIVMVSKREVIPKFEEWVRDRPEFKSMKVIIFTNTKREADEVCGRMRMMRIPAASIHGDKSQRERDEIISDFKTDDLNCLVATSVAARGLDVKNVELVVNLGFPTDFQDFIHRTGRTARAGKSGDALTFFDYDQTHAHTTAPKLVHLLKSIDQQPPRELLEVGAGHGHHSVSRQGSGHRGGSGFHQRAPSRNYL